MQNVQMNYLFIYCQKNKYKNIFLLILVAEKIETRYTYESLYGLIAEINILARCNFVVCTFTSNVIYNYE
jgi:hypothetical protein